MHTYTMRGFEVNKQHADFGIPLNIAHRQKHAVTVIAGKGQCLRIDDSHQAGVAALVRAGWITAMVDGGEKEKVPALDKGLMLFAHLVFDDDLLQAVSQITGIVPVLQLALLQNCKNRSCGDCAPYQGKSCI